MSHRAKRQGYAAFLACLVACAPLRPETTLDSSLETEASPTPSVPLRPPLRLRFLGDFNLAGDLVIDGVAVGGISGLVYEAPHLLALSDGHRAHGPPRIYRLTLSLEGALSIAVEGQIVLDARGVFDPDRFDAEGLTVVPEGWLVSSEGDRSLPPAIDLFDRSGVHRRRLEVPRHVVPRDGIGTRPNRGLEGLSALPSGAVVAAMEEALLQDGPTAGEEAGTCVRLLRYAGLAFTGEHAYCTDPLPSIPRSSPVGEALVGVSALAYVDADRLLVLERTALEVAGRFRNRVRIYSIDPSRTRDLRGLDRVGPTHAVDKRLVIDFDDIAALLEPATLDNFEAMALGPRLSTGERTLIVASDDNFSPAQRTAFVAFALEE